jgi:hypothetical protein
MTDLVQTSHVIYVLTRNPELDAQTLSKTVANVFLQLTNAAFYLYKHNEFYENA